MFKLNEIKSNNLLNIFVLCATVSLCACSTSNKPDSYQGLNADQIYLGILLSLVEIEDIFRYIGVCETS